MAKLHLDFWNFGFLKTNHWISRNAKKHVILDGNSNTNYNVNHGLFIAESRRGNPFEGKVVSIDAGEASKPEEAST